MIERYVRFEIDGRIGFGRLSEENVEVIRGDIFADFEVTEEFRELSEVRLLAPCQPGKIVALGMNYRDHAAELGFAIPGDPLIFLKPGTAVTGPDAPIVYPRMSTRVDYEAELGVVIGKKARFVPAAGAFDVILGYTCVNDVTARDLQKKDVQFTRSKSFDTFAPIGPCIARGLDPSSLKVESYLNGKLRQSSNTSNLIFGVPELVEFISSVMTLLPGDIISTGTPSGIGPMVPGDTVEIVVEGIGTLRNRVLSDALFRISECGFRIEKSGRRHPARLAES
ncbi:MAG: fumarylacetoacetate hydrolase family protein [Pseudomonadota bacterium]